jgi:branched-chain amino acid transport system substrate-binding protein
MERLMITRRQSLAVAGGALAALGLGASNARAAEEDLPIGIIGPLSGGGTSWGQAETQGVQLAIDDIMAAGGLKVGDKIYKPRTIAYDDQYSAAGGKTAADRLVNQDNVKFIFGSAGSPPTLGALAVTQPAKVMLFSGGFSPQILKNDFKAEYNFRIVDSNREIVPPMIAWLKNKYPEVKKVGLISASDWGPSVVPVLLDGYKAAGIDTWHENYDRGSKEFTPLITRMMAQNVDAFDVNSNAPGESGLLIKQARQAGFQGRIWQIGGPGVEQAIAVAGSLTEGFDSFDIFDFRTEVGKKFVAKYRAKYSGIVDSWVPLTYNAAAILFESIRRAGTLDTDKVRDVMVEKMGDFDAGLFGKVRWTGQELYGVNHQILLPFGIVEVQKGQIVTVATVNP